MKETELKNKLRSKLPMVRWTLIENMATPGPPDLYGCYEGVSLWIETKVLRGRHVKLRNEQVVWHVRHARAGGQSWIIGYRATDQQLYIWPGRWAPDLKERGLDLEPLWIVPLKGNLKNLLTFLKSRIVLPEKETT